MNQRKKSPGVCGARAVVKNCKAKPKYRSKAAKKKEKTHDADLLDAALAYASRGLPVLPLKPDKKPYIKGGFHNASTDPEQIKKWWSKWPGALIGVATGKVSGIDVLDIDRKGGKDGYAAIPNWQELSPVIVQTTTGGAHLWFMSEGSVASTAGVIARGVDTRGELGYIIMPPSELADRKSYTFLKGNLDDIATLPPLPPELAAKVPFPPEDKRTKKSGEKAESKKTAPIADVEKAVSVIPHTDDSWDTWNRVGMAIHVATGGSEGGFEIFDKWSQKHRSYSADGTRECWDKITGSPPNNIGAGTLFYLADEADPGWRGAKELVELNDKHAVVNEGGKTIVINFERDPITGWRTITRSKFQDLRDRYIGRSIDVGGKSIALAAWWLSQPARRTYDGIIFAPGKDVPGCYNLWQGFAVDPAPGDWGIFKDHILKNVCGSDEILYSYLFKWMARAVRYPGKPGEVAVVLRGGRGVGKGIFVRKFGALFGAHFKHVANAEHITGRFNAHLEDAVVLFADEALWAGDKKGAGVLKMLITEPTLAIEAKFQNVRQTKNPIHMIMASNNDWVIPAGNDERRFFVLDVGEARRSDTKFFGELSAQMKGGGSAALLHDLLAADLGGFDVRQVPQTKALAEQKELSSSIEQRWWLDCLEEGCIQGVGDNWSQFAPTSKVYDDYVEAARKIGARRCLDPARLGRFLQKALPGMYPRKSRKGGAGPAAYEFPVLKQCRGAFDEMTGVTRDWPDVSGGGLENWPHA